MTNAPIETATEDLIYQLAATGQKRRGLTFAARMSGLWVSRDEGQSWRSAYQSLGLTQDLPTLAVAAAPAGAAAPGGAVVFAGYNGGVLRSLDGGATWQNSALRLPAPAVVALAVSPNFRKDGMVFAGSLADGVFYSSDGGARWQSGNLGLIDPNVFCLAVSPAFVDDHFGLNDFGLNGLVFAGTQSGLFCSRNGGRAWREVALPSDFDAVLSLALPPAFAGGGFGLGGLVFAGTEAHGLLRSTDTGRTWAAVGQNVLAGPITQIVLAPDFARRPAVLALHAGGLALSENGGRDWQAWQPAALDGEAAVALLAPRGFDAGQPVLLGLESGRTVQVRR